jgi:hypothetical protein
MISDEIQQIILFVDCEGEIDISKQTEDDQKIIGEDFKIKEFIEKVKSEDKKMLIVDKREDPCVTSQILKGELYSDSIFPNKMYETDRGYDIIWQPHTAFMPYSGYGLTLILNPAYSNK